MKDDEKQIVINVIETAVKTATASLTSQLAALVTRCTDLEAQLAALPEKGDAGDQGEPGPQGEQGIKGDAGEGRDGRDGRNGKDGRDGIDGEAGRDVFELDILDGFDVDKTYHRGTFAAKNGGLWRYSGSAWVCLVDGLKGVEMSIDDTLQVKLTTVTAAGNESHLEFSAPGLLFKGVWKDSNYAAGDVVSYSGSMWVCLKPNKSKPGEFNKDWQLAVKRGRNGKSV